MSAVTHKPIRSGSSEALSSSLGGAFSIGYALLLAILLLSPWLNGGSDSPTQVYLFGALVVALLVALAAQVASKCRIVIPLVAWVVAGGVLLGTAQLVPLDVRFASAWLPSVQLRAELVEGLTVATWSLNAAATRHDIALLVMALGALVLGANLLDQPSRLQWLLKGLALNGAALSVFGFVQSAFFPRKLYGLIDIPSGALPFSSFVYHNQASNYLLMCLAACGGWLWLVAHQPGGSLARRLRDRDIEAWIALATLVLMVAGLFASLSRGAILAAAVSTVVTLLAMPRAKRNAVPILLGFAALAIAGAGLLFVGVFEPVGNRLETLVDGELLEREGRLDHWQAGLAAAADFGTTGGGLGSYRYLYRMYEDPVFSRWFYHAHNQYLEALVDGGALALLLVIAAIVLVARSALDRLRSSDLPSQALGVVVLFALVAQTLHAIVDYVLYLPANMLLFAVLCGAIFRPSTTDAPRWRTIGLVAAGMLALASCWAWWEIYRGEVVDKALRQVAWRQKTAKLELADVQAQIAALTAALETMPDHADGHDALAELWRAAYQLEARRTLSQELKIAETDENLWRWTAPAVLHHLAYNHRRAGDDAALTEMRQQEVIQDNLVLSVEHLERAQASCPLLPRTYLQLAELSFLRPNGPTDDELLARVSRLAPHHPNYLHEAGKLHFSAERFDSAYALWRGSLEASHRHVDDIRRLAGEKLTIEQLLEQVFPPSPRLLIGMARQIYIKPEEAEARRALLARAKQLLSEVELPADERAFLTGALALAEDRPKDAIEPLRAAVRLKPADVQWRYELADALYRSGDREAAEREAVFCLRLRPSDARIKALLKQIREAPRS